MVYDLVWSVTVTTIFRAAPGTKPERSPTPVMSGVHRGFHLLSFPPFKYTADYLRARWADHARAWLRAFCDRSLGSEFTTVSIWSPTFLLPSRK